MSETDYVSPTDKVKQCESIRGHNLEDDPPHALSSAQRWTCKECGDSVICYQGNVYGGAFERTCEESKAFWAVVLE